MRDAVTAVPQFVIVFHLTLSIMIQSINWWFGTWN